ncbi:hypothetical protein ACCO45_002993 [Purpureocillium lilacinum]|uniref:Uncharacterized protein n=1 Tax=Purpureocillium lilacinum TaxID=33203 RepID=A0ACC4DYK2_PURLI
MPFSGERGGLKALPRIDLARASVVVRLGAADAVLPAGSRQRLPAQVDARRGAVQRPRRLSVRRHYTDPLQQVRALRWAVALARHVGHVLHVPQRRLAHERAANLSGGSDRAVRCVQPVVEVRHPTDRVLSMAARVSPRVERSAAVRAVAFGVA